MRCDHVVQLFTCCICGCAVHKSRRLAGGFAPTNRNLSQLRENFTNRQGLKNAENSICSSSKGFGPTLTMMTKLFASWPATLTKLSAGFSATLGRTSNLFQGQPRSRILRCPQIVALFAFSFVDCEGISVFLLGAFSFRVNKVGSLIEFSLQNLL